MNNNAIILTGDYTVTELDFEEAQRLELLQSQTAAVLYQRGDRAHVQFEHNPQLE